MKAKLTSKADTAATRNWLWRAQHYLREVINSLLRIGILLVILIGLASAAPIKNDFDLAGSLVPEDEILSGGPPRDGIPSIDRPKFLSVSKADYIKPTDRVLGISRNGVVKAYPIAILNFHEIVNDRFGDEPLVVTFCPLCGSGMAFLTDKNNMNLLFGVSGLLYNSDVLLYDRQTNSLWSQLMRTAISGKLKGQRLTQVPLDYTTWADWKQRYPNTLVLSQDTGFRRDYKTNPYDDYLTSEHIMFPVKFRSQGFHPKELVIGLQIDGKFKAYPFAELAKQVTNKDNEIRDSVAGKSIVIRYNAEHRTGTVFDTSGKPLSSTTVFWFAWFGFHPDTAIYRSK
ncbi:MAG: DUF3179 domain-containing protein [Methylotenera sp.]|uniref:DUF3179 domain-containing protein n=1 Tax=Methylotenera sp. TaxID=2051956 RepID=UPI0024898EB6|nr:DUF3179 domain-containing protein [Methylotenera sp.]MDI1309280.1 DUF3179 domain-containing protein [Methylotenera sp.]